MIILYHVSRCRGMSGERHRRRQMSDGGTLRREMARLSQSKAEEMWSKASIK